MILSIGELLIDFICTENGRSLQTGETFLKKTGGAPLNVCVAINKLGGKATICGSVGNDSFGTLLINTVEEYGVKANVHRSNQNTTLAFVSLDEQGDRDFEFLRGADEDYKFSYIDQKTLDESSIFHFGSCSAFLGGDLETAYADALEYALANDKIISFDPNYRDMLFGDKKDVFRRECLNFISKSHLVKVSDEEIEIITGKSIEEGGKELVEAGAKYVLVTCGKDGAMLFHKGGVEVIKSEPVKMVDATGAGDAFIGTILAQIDKNGMGTLEDLLKYIALANKVGGVVVQRYGALDSIPSLDEIS